MDNNFKILFLLFFGDINQKLLTYAENIRFFRFSTTLFKNYTRGKSVFLSRHKHDM